MVFHRSILIWPKRLQHESPMMAMSDETELTVEEFVDYCQTQAGLLSGDVETMSEEVDELLDEIDEEMATVRSQLEEQTDSEVDVEAVEEMESDIEEKQAIIEAKQARMHAFQDLATGYTELAQELESEVDDGYEALERVVAFEADHDAPAYFEDRQTVYEAAAESNEADAE